MRVHVRAIAALAAGAGVLLASAVGAAPATADGFDVNTKVATWDTAAATLGTAGSLWEPRRTAGLDRRGRIAVIADNLAFAQGAAIAGDTTAAGQYGTRARSIAVMEKWANTGWSAEPAVSTSMAPVGVAVIRLGSPGMRTSVTARVFSNCFPQPADADPRPIPKRFRCTRADVLRHGGILVMTARPASTMTAPGDTTVRIETRGLTYRELLDVAGSLEQVAGAPTVAGSAQMVGMCNQMVTGSMTAEQASAFAQSNGYTTRLGSIDGAPLPVTADYRPDRFTLAMVGGVVSSCTFG